MNVKLNLFFHHCVPILVQKTITFIFNLNRERFLSPLIPFDCSTWSAKCLTRNAVWESLGFAKCSHLIYTMSSRVG